LADQRLLGAGAAPAVAPVDGEDPLELPLQVSAHIGPIRSLGGRASRARGGHLVSTPRRSSPAGGMAACIIAERAAMSSGRPGSLISAPCRRCTGSWKDDSHGDHPYPRRPRRAAALRGPRRSEEHTSELQSREKLVCRLL